MTVSLIMSVRPSVLMKNSDPTWKDFHEIWYSNIIKKSVEKIKASLKSKKNNGYFKRRTIYIYNYMWLNYS